MYTFGGKKELKFKQRKNQKLSLDLGVVSFRV